MWRLIDAVLIFAKPRIMLRVRWPPCQIWYRS